MKKYLLLISIIICIAFLQSCATANIQSKKEAGYDQKLNRIYIIVSSARDAKVFGYEFLSDLKEKLKKKNVLATGYIRNPLSLESDEDIDKRINSFFPEAILVIKQTDVTIINNSTTSGSFELQLIDPKTKKTFWKAWIDSTGLLGLDAAAGTTAKKLIEKMIADKLI